MPGGKLRGPARLDKPVERRDGGSVLETRFPPSKPAATNTDYRSFALSAGAC
jgi:hypothetical protein